MSDGVQIEVTGLDKLLANFKRFEQEISKGMAQAGVQAAKNVILNTPGIRPYPPAGAQNRKGRMTLAGKGTANVRMVPMGWYVRGRGWHSPTKQYYTSQRLGTQWTVEADVWQVTIGNRTDYAPYVVGEEQSRVMEAYGWRKLTDVARERLSEISATYQRWIDRLIKRLGL